MKILVHNPWVFIVMGRNFKITEKRLLKVIQSFLNNHFKNEYVDSFGVDTDKVHGRIVVNVFFNQDLDREQKSDFYENIIDGVEGYFGETPWVYSHYSKNYTKHKL